MTWLVSESALCEERSGKVLSDCLAVNFAVGCTHGCLFCYAPPAYIPASPFTGRQLSGLPPLSGSKMSVPQIVALALRTVVAPDLTLPVYKRVKTAKMTEEGDGL